MKKRITLILILIISLLCTSALALEPADVVGTWRLIASEGKGLLNSSTKVRVNGSVTLTEDCVAILWMEGTGFVTGAWEIKNDVVIVDGGTPDELIFAIEKDVLVSDTAYNIWTFIREEGEIQMVDRAPEREVYQVSAFDGEWFGSTIDIAGVAFPLAMQKIALSFTISGGMLQSHLRYRDEEITSEVQGEFEDSVLKVEIERAGKPYRAAICLRGDKLMTFTLTTTGRSHVIYCEKTVPTNCLPAE